ncbi:MAG: biotin--[acetyl-CoA-carboxylase] ligase [Treponema sp.]|jgi:BirA family biotin operon repressor/biotin-[acetyl-CoA-carboxylase] ligase|nr:biotin--[acetyl-CoA-carboxylase] ligase [Treponema sp.]
MVNTTSTRAALLMTLREKAGKPVSGGALAQNLGVSRVAVWKGIQALSGAGYPIETRTTGYTLDPAKANDFLHPWEFGEQEAMFRHFDHTGSTMDRARECAQRGLAAGTVITAEKQSAGRGRNGSAWASRQGGLFCTILERPGIALADYYLPAMLFQIAAARALGSFCGKPVRLRWPNDLYIDKRKIAGVMTELAGEADSINWLTIGIGVNVNNAVPSEKAVSCAGITGHTVSRREVLLKIINEAERLKKHTRSGTAYAQGNRFLAAEWNSLADCMGAKAAVVYANKICARGIFDGIDPAGRCIIKSENGKGTLYFNPGPVSVVF